MSSLQSGQVIQHYRIIEKNGQAGMGEVYKAEDQKLGRIVTLKLLPVEAQEEKNAQHISRETVPYEKLWLRR